MKMFVMKYEKTNLSQVFSEE